MQKEELKLCSYAKKEVRMDLNNEADLKEFKENYREFINTLWDNIKNNKKENKDQNNQGPYSDPDTYSHNPLFYEDLCRFLNSVSDKNFVVKNNSIKCNGEKFCPDQFGFSAPSYNLNHIYDIYLKLSYELSLKKEENEALEIKDRAIEKVINWIMESRTIGGAFIWPEYIWNKYNTERGGAMASKDYPNKYFIEDRVDLTLLDIKHYLEEINMKPNILCNNDKEKKWLESFKDVAPSKRFKKYVDTFLFNDFVDENYMPYDIVKSNFAKINSAKRELIPIDENELDTNKKNSIYNKDLETVERILNNVNILIKERSIRILQKNNSKNNRD